MPEPEQAPLVQSPEWSRLADLMVAIDTRVARLDGVSDAWWRSKGSPSDAESAIDDVTERLRQVKGAVDKALSSPLERTRDLGSEVGALALDAARRARAIAKKLGHAAEDTLRRLEDDFSTVPREIGMGIGLVLVIAALIFLGRSSH